MQTNVVTFFGYEVKPGSWGLSQSRKDSISAMLFPSNQKQMQSFLGAANFFMLNGPPHCTNVLLLVSTGHHLLGSKITRPSLTSSSHLFISLIIIYHGLSALMPQIMLWVLFCSKSTVILMGRYINQLPLLLASFQARLLIGTRSNKKPILYTMQ